MEKRYITSVPNAPKAVGPYSPAVITKNGYIFLSGQIPLNPETSSLIGEDIQSQTSQVLKNIDAVLSHVGKEVSDIVKTTIYLTDLSNFQTVNEIYGKWLGDFKPARTTIQVAALPFNSKVEIECIVE